MKIQPYRTVCFLAAGFLFIALAKCPYGYYQLLRIAITAASVYIAVFAYNCRKIWVMWLFIVILVLFNPLQPITFSREIWQNIDGFSAFLFIAVGCFVPMNPAKNNS